ncbi:proline-serine-threonine phosphatase-interacting protein 2 isoform X2 [Hypomesus transpacificus]|uniref:proline-serine-threonine phosphatase-interacting protein 2 isoform X2 n=1 Tax=Hypomesus transpacificus TaxID=137520 RepID=UPI001F082D88|nr:proline-serine-threonine phosphatase-interacting protein 2 isoform X2 [Hypomesus transpacificus]
MRDLHFKDNFWNPELTCTAGYDAIIQHLTDGKRTCREVEDFMKARAAIEEKYAKELLGLSKKVCGHNEMNTLKRSLDMFKLQTEHVSLSHLTLAQTMREEARRLEDFREKQKEARKKTKKTYEQKCRDREEVEQNMNRNAGTTNTKLLEKLYTKAQHAKQTAEEADKMYVQNVLVLGKIREDWQTEHAKACEIFEKQEVERISTLRNMVWTHLNHLSQQCVTSDELYEEVRKSLEQCDIQEDIGHFINLRRTGDKPPAPVLYENFYSGQRSTGPCPSPRQPPPIIRKGPLPDPLNNTGDVVYATVQEPGYSLLHH